MKTFDIHTSTPHLVEKKKIWYLIPVAILVVSVIIGVIFNFTMSEGTLLPMWAECASSVSPCRARVPNRRSVSRS